MTIDEQLHSLVALFEAEKIGIRYRFANEASRKPVELYVLSDAPPGLKVGEGDTLAAALANAFATLASRMQKQVTDLEAELLKADTRKRKAFLLANGRDPNEHQPAHAFDLVPPGKDVS